MSLEAAERPNLLNWEFAGPIAGRYEFCHAPIAMIVGPTGGGKSTASARRCLRVAMWQKPSPRDGVRRARILVICPTYRRAWDQVMPSYFKVFPKTMGEFRGSRGDPADHIFDVMVNIEGRPAQVHVEVLFRAVNDLDIEDFFRGFEFTAIWLPEADTNGDLATILSLGSNRVGRYPEPEDRPDDGESTYAGIFGDANAPIIGSAFHDRFYLKRINAQEAAPESDRLFIQPSGFSPNAENMRNLRRIRPDYYAHMATQLDAYDQGRMIGNKPGVGRHGQPVHPNFDYETHVATRPIDVDPFGSVFIGIDCGSGALVPGATFSQRSYSGQWRTLAEIFLNDGQMNTEELGAEVRRILNARFGSLKRDVGAMLCLDLAAGSRGANTQFTTAQHLQAYTGIEATLSPTNNPKARRTKMDALFLKSVGPGEAAKVIDPGCLGLIQGYSGGWHYPKRGNVISPSPDKGKFSHVCEADEYALLTAEGIDATDSPFLGLGGEADSAPLRVNFGD